MNKKNLLLIISFSIISFTGCTSKYQTNKIPEEEKIVIPEKIEEKRYYLNNDIKKEFEKYIVKEFNNGIEKRVHTNKTNKVIKKTNNLWNIGYELDKKRY